MKSMLNNHFMLFVNLVDIINHTKGTNGCQTPPSLFAVPQISPSILMGRVEGKHRLKGRDILNVITLILNDTTFVNNIM